MGIMKLRLRSSASQRLTWLKWAVVLMLLLIAGGCTKTETPGKKGRAGGPGGSGGARPPVQVQPVTVQRISIQRQVDIAGTLISPDSAKVSSEVAGVVREILVELGHEVKPGSILVRLDPRELQLALAQAEANLHQTEAQLGIDGVNAKEPPPDEQISTMRSAIANRDDARAQMNRAERLIKQRLLSQADLDTAITRVKVTEAAYQSALETVQSLKATLKQRRAAVELAQKKLSDAVIKAPVAGSVAERLVQPGEYIRENTPVISLVQVNPLKLKTAVQERHASLIRPGLDVKFEVETYPGETFSGRVGYVSPAVDQATRTFTVEVLVDNQQRRLKPGFFTKGVINTQMDENVMAVSEDAVSVLAGVSTVYVLEGGKVRQQIVDVGVRQGNLLEITKGLKGDETLAGSNLSQLATGVPVNTGAAGDSTESPRPRRQRSEQRADEGARP
jgi:RND family efflux transporter MFP subunit